tara:strand:+ start:1304 stop:1960 length:657 start_codon:yes stop_codon:yes gene_type:complete
MNWEEKRRLFLEETQYWGKKENWGGYNNVNIRNAFIHIPKTGGFSVNSVMTFHSLLPPHCLAKHLKYKVGYNDFFLFSFMRNPYSRIVSLYEFLLKSPKGTAPELDSYIREENDFCFEHFVQLVTEEVWNILWEPQTSFILDDDDNVIVNYIGRTETLKNDIVSVAKKIGIKNIIEEIPHHNKTIWSRPDYQSYYDNCTRKKIEKYYERDIEFLKEKF